MEIPRHAFHLYLKDRRILICVSGPKFFSENPYRRDKVIGFDRGCAQSLYSIPALIDRLIRPINRDLKCFPGFDRTLREQVDTSLKMEHQALKALQQCIVQFPRDACPFVDACFQPYRELMLQLLNAELINPQSNTRKTAPHDTRNHVVW